MPKPNRLQRQQFRNQRAAEAARQRKHEDPWEQARRRVRELHLPPSCALFVDAIAERHRELGAACRDAPVHVGYGDGTDAEKRSRNRKPVQRPRHPPEYPTLTEVTGCSRRTVLRARKLVEGHEILNCRRDHGAGAPRERAYSYRTRAGVMRHIPPHLVGIGGCDRGGQGLANGYWPWGMEDPDPPLPKRPPAGADGRPAPRRMGELWERAEAQRRGRPAPSRGP